MCNSFKKELGKTIREIHHKRGMTQEKLYLDSGISRSHIAMIESVKRDLTVSALFKILRALNVNSKEIFDLDYINIFKFNIEELYK